MNLQRIARTFIDDTCPSSPQIEHTSMWLLGRVDRLRVHSTAATMYRQIMEPVEKARYMIDRPPDRWYAGPCDCGHELYAQTGQPVVECVCGRRYEMRARREWLLAAAEDRLAPAPVIARAINWLGEKPLTPSLIRVWANRGRLLAKGHEPYGEEGGERPLYRVGDVLDLLARDGGET